MITLKTLPQATTQQVFDQVAVHLLTQNAQSKDSAGECLYRGPNGLKCAAGCLIGDDEYQGAMENKTWAGLFIDSYIKTRAHNVLISRLQDIHDDFLPYEWAAALRQTAWDYKLNTEALDAFPTTAVVTSAGIESTNS